MTGAALHRVAVLARHNAILRLRDPAAPIVYLVLPAMMMYVLRPLYGAALPGSGDTHAVVGMLVLFSTLSIGITGNALLVERTWHTWDLLRATPASTTELVLGKSAPVLALLLLQQTLLLALGAPIIGPVPPAALPLVTLAVVVWGLFLLALGSLLAAVARSHGEVGVASDVGGFTSGILGGALVPVAMMPGWAQAVAPLSPGYWAIGMLKAALAGDAAGTLGPAGVLGAVGAVIWALACLRISRGAAEVRG